MTNEELREIVEVEGDIYSAMQSFSPLKIEDGHIRRLWIDAERTMRLLEEELYSDDSR